MTSKIEKLLVFFVLSLFTNCNVSTNKEEDDSSKLYEASQESISTHPLPDWYEDSKLGIFFCWGLYSVPGWAQGTEIPLEEVFANNLGDVWFRENPYAEWYLNSLKIDGSTTQAYHAEAFGEDFSYDDFIPMFNESSQNWDPEGWADLVKDLGAGYVVLVSKFHDGFVLWPTKHPNPNRPSYVSERDIVGEFSTAIKDRGIKVGLYYSSGLDWTYNDKTIKTFPDLYEAIPQQQEYVEYIDSHWRELIDRYDPHILWADIGSPNDFDAIKLISDFYNKKPDGVVNNRHKLSLPGPTGVAGEVIHHDFTTPEYQVLDSISEQKWETVRGIGLSFGYNQNESETEYLSVDELVDMFIDIVSKNGNLLLNVGPKADGSIPQEQLEVLKGFSKWLKKNGVGLYGSRPWKIASLDNHDGSRIRFTQKGKDIYLYVLDFPSDGQVKLEGVPLESIEEITSLAEGKAIEYAWEGSTLSFEVKDSGSAALGFKIR